MPTLAVVAIYPETESTVDAARALATTPLFAGLSAVDLARLVDGLRDHLQATVDAGYLHPDATSDEALALYTSMTAGLLSQQMANEPDVSHEEGRFSRLLPVVLEMFYQRYAPTRGK